MSEDVPEDHPMQISSVVQNRGSIPLFWSQETSRLNLKPDIVCKFCGIKISALLPLCLSFLFLPCLTTIISNVVSKKEPDYEATRLHFDNLVERYGNPIIILNLIKVSFLIHLVSVLLLSFYLIHQHLIAPLVFTINRQKKRGLESQSSEKSLLTQLIS